MSHYQKEWPFEVPEGWVWTRIGEIADVARGGSPRPIENYITDDSTGINWIKIGDAEQGGKYINATNQKIRREGISRSRFVHRGDFLLTNSMSFGRPYILNVDGCIHDGWLVISPFNNVLDKEYFYYLLSSDYAYQQFTKQASGAVVSNLNRDKVSDLLIPLPPLHEQTAIAKRIDLFFSRISILDSELFDLERSVSKTKAMILDLAIHGKLVPQDPSDEPAIDLLHRINPSFKPSDNLHYEDCPAGWQVVNLKEIVILYSGRDLEATRCNAESHGIPYLVGASCIDDCRLSIYRWTDSPEVISKRDDVLLSCKGTVGEVILNSLGDVHIARQFMAIRSKSPKDILPEYVEVLVRASIQKLKNTARGIIPGISRGDILEMVVAIPPLSEQKRILSRIQTLEETLSIIANNTSVNNSVISS